jgi:hypothetical protein
MEGDRFLDLIFNLARASVGNDMPKKCLAICLLPAIFVMPAAADPIQPLAPGKPAGIEQAQTNPKGVVFLGLLGAVAIGGLYLAFGANVNATSATGTSP